MLSTRIAGLGRALNELAGAALFLQDLRSFVAMGARPREPLPAPQRPTFSSVAADGVSFCYPGSDRAALTEVSFDIHAGQVVAVVGENGSGKTTLAKLLAGLYAPTQGTVSWDGMALQDIGYPVVRESVAVLFQDFLRFKVTAAENIGMGRPEELADRAGVEMAAERADAYEFLSRLDHGLDALLSKEFIGGVDLSIGQWQRVALARAFFRDAPLVILDEPTAALDPKAEARLFERMRTLFAGRTVVLISHRFSSVRQADRVLVLDQGRLVEQGGHFELMAAGGTYAELLIAQAAAYLDEPAVE